MIINLPLMDLPLCPNTQSPLHQLLIQVQNAAYNAVPKNEDLEFDNPQVEAMYQAISYNQFSGRMYLYKEGNYVSKFQRIIESYYYRCGICGFVVSAVGLERPK